MIDLEDMDDIAAEVADIMGNGNLDLSNLNFSVLQDFPDEAEINVPPVKEEKKILSDNTSIFCTNSYNQTICS